MCNQLVPKIRICSSTLLFLITWGNDDCNTLYVLPEHWGPDPSPPIWICVAASPLPWSPPCSRLWAAPRTETSRTWWWTSYLGAAPPRLGERGGRWWEGGGCRAAEDQRYKLKGRSERAGDKVEKIARGEKQQGRWSEAAGDGDGRKL